MREVENHMLVISQNGDRDFVTWGKVNKKYYCGATGIEKKDFIDWLKNRQIDVVLFNEQNWWIPVIWCKE